MQRVIGAVADGDLSKKVSADVRGEMLELKNTINAMVDQLNGFISEVTRVAREVGTEGKLGQAAAVTIEVGGVWKDLTDNVNLMAGNLTGQVRNIAEVTTAVANGDLSKKISIDVKGEFLELKNTVNAMVDQLNAFAGEVTRVAREVGVEGKLGGQAQSKEVGGVWKDLTDNVNQLAANLTNQVRAIAEVATAVTEGDLTRQVRVEASGEVAVLKDKLNEMIRNLRETTRQNIEQDWLKTNRERFTRMLQGQRDLAAVSSMILSELAPLVSAQHGVFYSMTSPSDGGEPVLRAPGRLRLRGAQAPLDVVPARRGPRRPVRQGEEADPAHRRARRLREDQLRARRVASAQHHRAAGAVRRVGARRGRARLVLAVQRHPSGVPRSAHREHRPRRSAPSRPTPSPRTCSSSRSRRPRSSARSRRSCASRTRTSDGRPALLAEQNIEAEQKNQEVEQSKRLVEEKAGQLAVSSKYKSEFIANMSHELRTPLNSLLILAEQLEDNPDHNMTDTQVEYASVIHASGNDLLESAQQHPRPGQGRVGNRHGRADRRLGRRAARRPRSASSSPSRAAKGLGFSIDIAPDCPDDIVTDPQRLRQILKNLLANAFKFTEHGEVHVQVGLADSGWSRETRVARRRRRRCSPSRSATPASASTTSSSSGSSRRSPRATARRRALYGGTGLGLSISRELVGLLGGEITVVEHAGPRQHLHGLPPVGPAPRRSRRRRSPPDRDRCRRSPRPIAAAESRCVRARSRPARPARRSAPFEGTKILVVDDDFRNIFAMTALLERGHAEVIGRRERRRGDRHARADARHRHRPDGHHDAGHGRLRDHARHPGASSGSSPPDHRGHRQGRAPANASAASTPAPTTTCPSRSTPPSSSPRSGHGCRTRAGA